MLPAAVKSEVEWIDLMDRPSVNVNFENILLHAAYYLIIPYSCLRSVVKNMLSAAISIENKQII